MQEGSLPKSSAANNLERAARTQYTAAQQKQGHQQTTACNDDLPLLCKNDKKSGALRRRFRPAGGPHPPDKPTHHKNTHSCIAAWLVASGPLPAFTLDGCYMAAGSVRPWKYSPHKQKERIALSRGGCWSPSVMVSGDQDLGPTQATSGGDGVAGQKEEGGAGKNSGRHQVEPQEDP